ncbi:MAG: SPOR domain-containing protein [Candidatus Accumulibacter sp.]|jgi:DedD protein|nr:SPOR domain-containing protein [Accumulibacter sp.]
MASNEGTDFNGTLGERDDSARLRRKLAWRMGVAGLMIAALLGGLSLFDYLATRPDEPEPAPPRFTEPVPVPKKSVTQALGPVVPAPDEEADKAEKAEKEAESVPESTEAPPPRLDDSATPPPEAVTGPTPGRAARQPSRSPSALPPATSGRSEQKGRLTEAAPPRPSARETEAAPAPTAPRPSSALPRLLPGYTLQAGVFADPQRAEDVLAKLRQEGIPATLETRVVVGPFKNRGEAETARARMKALGIDALPILRGGKP